MLGTDLCPNISPSFHLLYTYCVQISISTRNKQTNQNIQQSPRLSLEVSCWSFTSKPLFSIFHITSSDQFLNFLLNSSTDSVLPLSIDRKSSSSNRLPLRSSRAVTALRKSPVLPSSKRSIFAGPIPADEEFPRRIRLLFLLSKRGFELACGQYEKTRQMTR